MDVCPDYALPPYTAHHIWLEIQWEFGWAGEANHIGNSRFPPATPFVLSTSEPVNTFTQQLSAFPRL